MKGSILKTGFAEDNKKRSILLAKLGKLFERQSGLFAVAACLAMASFLLVTMIAEVDSGSAIAEVGSLG